MQPWCEVVHGQSPSDAPHCTITGSKILPDGRLIVADAYNKSVKLFDTKHKLVDKLQLQLEIWNITLVGDDQVLVTVYSSAGVLQMHEMQFVIVRGKTLTLGHSIQTNTRYYCTVYFEGQLFVVDCTDETIKVLDMTGKILRTMDKSPDWPRFLAVSPVNRVLYVVYYLESTVKCMTLDGEVLTVFKHGQLRFFKELTVHPDGSVYVCTWTSIHHITSQCTHIETILDHGELHYPMAICVNPSGDRLYVSDWNGSTMKVFCLGD